MRAPARLIPDASVVVQWFAMEERSSLALRLRRTFRGRMTAPDLLLHECVNALWKRVRKGEMTFARADAMVEFLPKIVEIVLSDAALARRALFIADALGHPSYDCFYLAFAEREGLVVATDDRRLLGAAKGGRWGDFVISLPDAAREWAE